ncbi:MAG: carboxypeptidase regulatory-like domain-containing protein, partial [Acidobacteria bacterium]|nr:carboxypeptidase regulatory-like domain-containing protein [Acidobacteriota bacterium]
AQRNQQNPPFATAIKQTQTSTSGPINFSAPWSAGTVTTNPFPQPQIPTPAIAQFFAQSQYIVLPAHYHPSYSEQWTASVQRQFGQWQFQMQYIGSHTVHAPAGTPLSPAIYVPGVWGAGGTGCAGVVTTGPAGKPAGAAGTPCSTVANQTQRYALTVANPLQGNQYSGGSSSILMNYNGMSNYNGLVTSIQHRLSSSFSLMANHTWSKCLGLSDAQGDTAGNSFQNPSNPAGDYGPCGSDYRHIENVVLITTTRFPLTGFKALLANNWVFAPLIHVQSGAPFNVTAG